MGTVLRHSVCQYDVLYGSKSPAE